MGVVEKPSKANFEEQEQEDKLQSEKPFKKTEVCYYVMKLAKYGELYRFVEHTDRF